MLTAILQVVLFSCGKQPESADGELEKKRIRDQIEQTHQTWKKRSGAISSHTYLNVYSGEYAALVNVLKQSPQEACNYYFSTFPTGNPGFLILLCDALNIDHRKISTSEGFDGLSEKLTELVRDKCENSKNRPEK